MSKELQAPGPFLAIMLEKYKLNPFKLSKDIRLSQSAVRLITIGKTKITTPVAMRLAKYFNTNPEFWLAMQMKWDIAEASKDKALVKIVNSIPRVTKPTAGGGSEKKPVAAKKPAAAKKKPATKKKPAAKKRATAKKPRLAKKSAAATRKSAVRKPVRAKKAVVRKSTATKKTVGRKPVRAKKAAVRKPRLAKKPVAARKAKTGKRTVAARAKTRKTTGKRGRPAKK